MNKDDVKKLDEVTPEAPELTSEELEKINGGSILRECWEDLLEEWKNH